MIGQHYKGRELIIEVASLRRSGSFRGRLDGRLRLSSRSAIQLAWLSAGRRFSVIVASLFRLPS